MAIIHKYDKTEKAEISNRMKAIRILVTAGPTREFLDPVRFISNPSTGAMGYAIAAACKGRGHKVTLVTGPTHLIIPGRIKAISTVTAREMFLAVKARIKAIDCVIMAAAVSDFRPAVYHSRKIKRKEPLRNLALRENMDILQWLKRHKGNRILAGFCMETEDLLLNAQKKMREKGLDIIVSNKIDRDLSAFGPGKTKVVIIGPGKEQQRLVSITKERIAAILLDKIERLWYKKA